MVKHALCALMSVSLWAQVDFKVQPRRLAQNGALMFSVSIENPGQSGSDVEWPNGLDGGEDFEWLRNSTSNQTSISVVNGRATHVRTMSYQFRPKKQGTLTFPAQIARVNGKDYRSEAVQVEVGPPNSAINPQRSSPFSSSDPFADLFERRSTRQVSQPELIVRSEVPKTQYYVGESIPFKTRFFLRGVNVDGSNSQMDLPSFEGFWVEELGRSGSESEYQRIDGKDYETYVVDARLLYPNKPGTLVIPATKLNLMVSTGGRLFGNWQRVYRETEEISLEIKALPKGAPTSFSGAVGKFSLVAELDRSEVKVGEPVSLKVTLTGTGNFSAITDLAVENLDPSLELFSGGTPQVERQQGRVRAKTWTYAIVPKTQGSFEVPRLQFSFFDPDSEKYQNIAQGPFPLRVLAGDGDLLSGGPVAANRMEISDESLRFIKLDGGLDAHHTTARHPQPLLKLAGGFALVDVLLLVWMGLTQRSAMRRAELRPKFAYRHFKKALQQLRRRADQSDSDAFHSQLSDLIFTYFGDKWERPAKGISLELVADEFRRKGLDEQLHQQLVEIIEACDLARFTPSSSASRENLVGRTADAIAAVEEMWT